MDRYPDEIIHGLQNGGVRMEDAEVEMPVSSRVSQTALGEESPSASAQCASRHCRSPLELHVCMQSWKVING